MIGKYLKSPELVVLLSEAHRSELPASHLVWNSALGLYPVSPCFNWPCYLMLKLLLNTLCVPTW